LIEWMAMNKHDASKSAGTDPDDDQDTVDGTSDARFVLESGFAANLAELIDPVLVDLGFRLVRVAMNGGANTAGGPSLQIMAERPDGTFSIDDCATVSRELSPVLDAYDPLPGAYRLEVSSPGIDRPLVRPSDFEDWAGYEAKIELSQPVNGRKRFRGIVEGFADGEVRIECTLDKVGTQLLGFPMHMIGEAKLVLTDELVRETLRRTKKLQQGLTPVEGGELSDEQVAALQANVPAGEQLRTKPGQRKPPPKYEHKPKPKISKPPKDKRPEDTPAKVRSSKDKPVKH
jgi:ribosome maturation factor RimP